jgi:ABC-type nitrate/sulfonate/bicarbonate transport system substrate-binding protein
MKHILIRMVLAVVALVVCVSLFSCKQKDQKVAGPPEKISIAITPWPASAPLYIAHEKGYFKDEGLEATLESHESGPLAFDAMLSGKYDIAGAADTPIARAAVNGRRFAVVATICEIERPIQVIARKDRGISSADDLRGKRVGLVSGSAAEFFLHIYLTTHHIDPAEVRATSLDPAKVVNALTRGDVDAVSTWAPHTIEAREKLGDNAQILHDPGLYKMTWNIAARREFAEEYPGRIKKFLRAVVRANRFIEEHPEEARAITARKIGAAGALYEREWQDYSFSTTLDQSLIENLEDQARWMIKREAGAVRETPNFMESIFTDGLKTVRPEEVRISGK